MDDSLKPQYLRVRNWEKFQHYKDRRPPWIKYHVETLDDYELTRLPYVTQLTYDRLLLISAKTDNNIPYDPDWLSQQTHIEVVAVDEAIQNLLNAGFLLLSDSKRAASKVIAARKQRASKQLAARKQNAIPETETEAETETKSEEETNPRDLGLERATRDVYDHWRKVRGKTDRRYDRLSPQRRQKIRSRLAEFTADDLKRALTNVALDGWADRAKHDDITTLFKNRESVDRWLDMTGKEVATNDDLKAYDRFQ